LTTKELAKLAQSDTEAWMQLSPETDRTENVWRRIAITLREADDSDEDDDSDDDDGVGEDDGSDYE